MATAWLPSTSVPGQLAGAFPAQVRAVGGGLPAELAGGPQHDAMGAAKGTG